MKNLMLEILANEVKQRNKLTNQFKSNIFNRVLNSINKQLGMNCSPKHVENHLKTPINTWNIVQTLLNKSGHVWDDNLMMITVSPRVYALHIQWPLNHESVVGNVIELLQRKEGDKIGMGAIGREDLKKWEKMQGAALGSEEKILVLVRLRPLSEKEITRNEVSDWECINETTILYRNSLQERSRLPTAYTIAREFIGKDNKTTLSASVNFLDLAGSERASQALSIRKRLKEGCHINRSLLTLGTVIHKLRSNASHKRSIVASLVKGVLILERDIEDQSIFGAIFKYKSPNYYYHSTTLYNNQNPPKYVIAIQGTNTKGDSLCRDMKGLKELSNLLPEVNSHRFITYGQLLSQTHPAAPVPHHQSPTFIIAFVN
ncbi:hypothetical protein CQW23_10436 [Capsicum baccatum]|uniref:Kinesin motor domain-containing protein n=1 Tax=Capsicum baccatum TaxID=33114 RepID=A0A2G2WZT8_CAPBA|nr:hypothetical protein CQW23_10436 [Capsicum baccatum]